MICYYSTASRKKAGRKVEGALPSRQYQQNYGA
jgi:hypothetical protein